MDDKRNVYQCYTKDLNQEKVTAAFEKKYGEKPAEIFVKFKMIWAGPVPKQFFDGAGNTQKQLEFDIRG